MRKGAISKKKKRGISRFLIDSTRKSERARFQRYNVSVGVATPVAGAVTPVKVSGAGARKTSVSLYIYIPNSIFIFIYFFSVFKQPACFFLTLSNETAPFFFTMSMIEKKIIKNKK